MADSNRVSGRQAASTSGRQAPASVSGRAAAPSPSGRMPVAPPTARPASSARMAPAAPAPTSSSGRVSARVAPPPPAAPARASARKSAGGIGRTRGEDGGKKKKVRPMGGKELLLAAAGIAILAGIVMFLAFRNSSRQKAANDAVTAAAEAEKNNYDAAEKTFNLAFEKGHNLLFGKEEFNEAKHFGGFRSDNNVYNVIYERRFKDKKGNEKPQQNAMYPDKLSLMKTEYGTEREGIRINYALADGKATNVVIATKNLKPPEGDTLTVSASLTIIVKAPVEDPKFDKARNVQAPEAPKEAAPKDAPKEAGK